MSDVVVLRQGEPLVVLREREAPMIVERETPTSLEIERFGTTIQQFSSEPPVTDLLTQYRLLSN